MNKEKKLLMERNQQLNTPQELMEDHKERLLDCGAINNMATNYIFKYVNKKFSFNYWAEHTHGSTDYDEMPKLILYIMRQQLVYFYPLTLGNGKYTKPYNRVKDTLDKISYFKLNTRYIETFKIDLNEIKKDTFEILKLYFKNYTEEKEENNNAK